MKLYHSKPLLSIHHTKRAQPIWPGSFIYMKCYKAILYWTMTSTASINFLRFSLDLHQLLLRLISVIQTSVPSTYIRCSATGCLVFITYSISTRSFPNSSSIPLRFQQGPSALRPNLSIGLPILRPSYEINIPDDFPSVNTFYHIFSLL